MIQIRQPKVIETWVDYEGDEGEKYKLRFAPKEALEGKGEFERLDFILLDWQGINENGEPMPCNAENKLKFFFWDVEQNDAARYWWIYAQATTMFTFIDVKKTLARSKAPSNGGSTSQKPAEKIATNAGQSAIA
jgi:hypothetical protein